MRWDMVTPMDKRWNVLWYKNRRIAFDLMTANTAVKSHGYKEKAKQNSVRYAAGVKITQGINFQIFLRNKKQYCFLEEV